MKKIPIIILSLLLSYQATANTSKYLVLDENTWKHEHVTVLHTRYSQKAEQGQYQLQQVTKEHLIFSGYKGKRFAIDLKYLHKSAKVRKRQSLHTFARCFVVGNDLNYRTIDGFDIALYSLIPSYDGACDYKTNMNGIDYVVRGDSIIQKWSSGY
ncbi:hypothetical protein BCS84_06115 [Vibrio cyclitrophicus]|uniref:hypothetical protein n=1 Tax=Vibrio cyclitrophicus TaxID=47951 RepID=UPI000382947A|nr:hypothetical protein [Vibrio cyclitrophicus]OED86552.1 hypothetical protein OAQ_09975 [Vibrio cyclitrophicus ZF30]OEE19411.1 hypothetical protein OC1_18795 [Vibrio cyclitrophicus ZF207]PMJ34171.1 hypothetical protein BCU25_09620 [Vibrio cyclitrophicus]PMP49466.1 hypothetical protein BCS84_06850 [Vibrio cyclitrophicus]